MREPRSTTLLAAATLATALALPMGPASIETDTGAYGGAHATALVPGFEDIPLMPGLRALADRGHVFDTPVGRLVESHVGGRVDAGAARAFYRETLPSLGWQPAGTQTYLRDEETLLIEYSVGGEELTIRFRVRPKRRGDRQ